MARPKKTAPVTSAELLEFLPAARRQQILNEAVGSKVREIFRKYHQNTLGALVGALTGDSHWAVLQNVSVSVVLQPADRAAGGSAGAGKRGPGRPRGRKSKLTDATLDEILGVVEKSPGLRSEQIQRQLPHHEPRVIKQGLAKLRDQKRVKTSGQRRATTYTSK